MRSRSASNTPASSAALLNYVARAELVFRGIRWRGFGDITVSRWCEDMEEQARHLIDASTAPEGDPMSAALGPWDYGVKLACGHELQWGTAPTFDDPWPILADAPRRKDGWYRATRCPKCQRRRRVTNSFVRHPSWTTSSTPPEHPPDAEAT